MMGMLVLKLERDRSQSLHGWLKNIIFLVTLTIRVSGNNVAYFKGVILSFILLEVFKLKLNYSAKSYLI